MLLPILAPVASFLAFAPVQAQMPWRNVQMGCGRRDVGFHYKEQGHEEVRAITLAAPPRGLELLSLRLVFVTV